MDDATNEATDEAARPGAPRGAGERAGAGRVGRWHLELEHHLSSVPQARHWVVQRCARAGVPPAALTVVELLTAELTANAVLHGRPPVRLEVEGTAEGVRVAVLDADPSPPVRRSVGPEATGGRGVALVDLLSSDWGVEQRPAGKTVWFVVTAAAPER
ncbi:ATP-binding protein [Kineococcus indalonis]|uniref:ATP-binding protein n=1 Tax=Kineococcus indalonis TaxID=2696566 RepID=UPI0014127B1B|nr:ATP-binding protein [Kineococcus indalonis]NAZ86255.1 ATP-binding protein [Kineococcus indalonis]